MQKILNDNNFKFKKKYGQNFITDNNLIKNIVKKSNIDKETIVIEIGPGAGALTTLLAQSAKKVICYEIDKSLEPILSETLKEYDNVEVIYEDFLNADIKTYKNCCVISNLPYYITTPILMKLTHLNINKIVIMVQKEVGDRFKAKPGTKEYNSLSVYLNYYYNIKKLIDVSRNVFVPKPNVDSIVIEFTQKEKEKVNEKIFFKLVRDSFTQKRKTIKNNLKGYDLKKVESVLKKYGYDLSVRAEKLEIKVFIDIANSL